MGKTSSFVQKATHQFNMKYPVCFLYRECLLLCPMKGRQG
uniref:Uncharacterized protein n=1 Tax=Arundo donax TaxID=35708 RepID=A0A0A9FPE1_ARUDO